jgi:hypothetical protein
MDDELAPFAVIDLRTERAAGVEVRFDERCLTQGGLRRFGYKFFM